MNVNDLLKDRRTVYAIGRDLPVAEDEIVKLVTDATELVPDAFNMRSQRVVLALGARQDELWDAVYDAFGGKVPREKVDGFKAGAGTVLYFYEEDVVKAMQEQVPSYAANFPVWANQANGMLQISIWTGLAALGVGASLQHYNPVIDDAVRQLFGLPASYRLVAQMPFGNIVAAPAPKDGEDISQRVTVVR